MRNGSVLTQSLLLLSRTAVLARTLHCDDAFEWTRSSVMAYTSSGGRGAKINDVEWNSFESQVGWAEPIRRVEFIRLG